MYSLCLVFCLPMPFFLTSMLVCWFGSGSWSRPRIFGIKALGIYIVCLKALLDFIRDRGFSVFKLLGLVVIWCNIVGNTPTSCSFFQTWNWRCLTDVSMPYDLNCVLLSWSMSSWCDANAIFNPYRPSVIWLKELWEMDLSELYFRWTHHQLKCFVVPNCF